MTTTTIDQQTGPGWATMSACGRYRYALGRRIAASDGGRVALWVMLNPSTADALVLDPTIRRCVGFSVGWGCAELVVVNLFAWRSTDPKALATADDPVGPQNDAAIVTAAARASVIVAAWGAHHLAAARARSVVALLAGAAVPLHCLGVTNTGAPRHPLYVRADQPLVAYGAR